MSTKERQRASRWGRLGHDGEPDARGRLFVAPTKRLQVQDLSGILVCHAGVDTVRALYRGVVQERRREWFEVAESGSVVRIGGQDWLFTRMGKAGGYRYSLRAADLGIQALIGSYYSGLDVRGGHLKVEVSPHYLQDRGVEQIQRGLDALAAHLLHDWLPSGVAVHLACDVQGWDPGEVGKRLVTRARRCSDYQGVEDVVFDLAEASATYGKGETYTLGLPSGVQLCLYDKTKEVVKRDKVDYWAARWESFTFGDYRPGQTVRRVEMRFHQSVVRQLGLSQGADWKTFADVAPHLGDLWKYALEIHRLQRDETRRIICPVWQLLMEDISFFHPAKGEKLFRQKEESIDAIAKNIQALIGNIMTLAARRNGQEQTEDQLAASVMWSLRQLICWPLIVRYWSDRRMNVQDAEAWIAGRLRDRRLRGRAA